MMEAKSPNDLPHHIIVDRCIIEGWAGNTTRGMYLDGTDIAVVGCQIVDITANSESIGILVTNTPGPILIENNAIGASGVNVFIGDNSPLRWSGVNAADITIRRNLLYKKPEWKSTNALKNHFEMKRGERVLFEDNDCVYSPVDAQTGFSIKLKTGGHDQYVSDVTIARNRIRQVNGYIAISNQSSEYTVRRVLSHDNQIRGLFPSSTAIAFVVPPPAAMVGDIAFLRDDLRGTSVKSFMALASRQPSVQRLECRELQTEHGEYGIKGDGTQTGTTSLDTYCEQYSLSGNAFFGQAFANRKDWYPSGNRHPARRAREPSRLLQPTPR